MARRKEFKAKTKNEARERSGGFCEAVGILYGLPKGKRCNAGLNKGCEFDHIVRCETAKDGDNTLENCAAVCIPCHRKKTSFYDVPQAAKTKRMRNKATGITRPKGTIQNSGFSKPDKPTKGKAASSLPPRSLYKKRIDK